MPWYAALAEKIWSRDGLWAIVALMLAGVMVYTYVTKFPAIEAKLDAIADNQIRACIRSGIRPIEACWPHKEK